MVVNVFTVFKAWLWPSMMHSIDGGVGSHGSESMKSRYGWRKCERWCYAFDMVASQVSSYVDGEEDSWERQGNRDMFRVFLEQANKKVKEPDMTTDVTVGCFLTEDSAGKINTVFTVFFTFHSQLLCPMVVSNLILIFHR